MNRTQVGLVVLVLAGYGLFWAMFGVPQDASCFQIWGVSVLVALFLSFLGVAQFVAQEKIAAWLAGAILVTGIAVPVGLVMYERRHVDEEKADKPELPQISRRDAAALLMQQPRQNGWTTPDLWKVPDVTYDPRQGGVVGTGLNLAGLERGYLKVKVFGSPLTAEKLQLCAALPPWPEAKWKNLRNYYVGSDGWHRIPIVREIGKEDGGMVFIRIPGAPDPNLQPITLTLEAEPKDPDVVIYMTHTETKVPQQLVIPWGPVGLPGYEVKGDLHVTILHADGTPIPEHEFRNNPPTVGLEDKSGRRRLLDMISGAYHTKIAGPNVESLAVGRNFDFPVRIEVTFVVESVEPASD